MKYKVGDILKVKKGHENKCNSFESPVGQFIKITSIIRDDYQYAILNDKKEKINQCNCFKDDDLEQTEKNWDNLEVGDEIDTGFGIVTVLDMGGRVVFISSIDDKNRFGTGCTKEELIKKGYTIVQNKVDEIEEEVIEIAGHKYSKQEVEEKLKDLKEIK
jgi:hypothetical protein